MLQARAAQRDAARIKSHRTRRAVAALRSDIRGPSDLWTLAYRRAAGVAALADFLRNGDGLETAALIEDLLAEVPQLAANTAGRLLADAQVPGARVRVREMTPAGRERVATVLEQWLAQRATNPSTPSEGTQA